MMRSAFVVLFLIGSSLEAGPVRLLDVNRAVTDAGKAKEALVTLGAMPLPERKTVEYHVALARAAKFADQPAQAAEAVSTMGLLPAQVAPNAIGLVGGELPSLRTWLEQRGRQLYDRAMDAQSKGDMKTAVKSYLVAVKCDPSLMAKDDRGLGKTGLTALVRMVERHPERADLLFQLGYYAYQFGDLPQARAALERQVTAEADPYRKWRGQTWLAMIRAAR